MNLPVIAEVIRRAEQGRTKPYLCRADDGLHYFVKHRALPARERVAEWLAGSLAQALGLPVAPFSLVEITDAFDSAAVPWLRELGPGVGFGSVLQEAREFTFSDVERLEAGLAARVAAFDWWLYNSDRSLTARGGNPNLLWRTDEAAEKLVLIDHNLAFEQAFSHREFLATHAFAAQFGELLGDFIERERVRVEFAGALERLPAAWANIPKEWMFTDAEQTIPAPWSRDEFMNILKRCHDADTFWSVPTP